MNARAALAALLITAGSLTAVTTAAGPASAACYERVIPVTKEVQQTRYRLSVRQGQTIRVPYTVTVRIPAGYRTVRVC